jgi:hypothetical protein
MFKLPIVEQLFSCEKLTPVLCHSNHIFEAHPSKPRQVDSWFYRNDHILFKRGGVNFSKTGFFVDGKADPMPKPVAEIVAVPGIPDEVSSR